MPWRTVTTDHVTHAHIHHVDETLRSEQCRTPAGSGIYTCLPLCRVLCVSPLPPSPGLWWLGATCLLVPSVAFAWTALSGTHLCSLAQAWPLPRAH